eukprot:TRINITY_DN61679_c0_g1_i1.p1 TRINITY_DN61679_c0_g1~~TRINITY_DN61679_c0_g1_i1.p1  ORF type:complete len:736 (+),score=102.36 TRINITY_DN61679_c0_g1_i1:44-2251(+)
MAPQQRDVYLPVRPSSARHMTRSGTAPGRLSRVFEGDRATDDMELWETASKKVYQETEEWKSEIVDNVSIGETEEAQDSETSEEIGSITDSSEEDFEESDHLLSGVPPELKRSPPQPQKRRRANRVSMYISRHRSSAFVVSLAVDRLGWERLRDSVDASALWVDQGESGWKISPYQLVSKFPGILQSCRKVDLAISLRAMLDAYPRDYAFVPRTWILSSALPEDAVELKQTMEEKHGWTFICKPTAGSQGKGVRLVKKFADLRLPLADVFQPKADGKTTRITEYVVQRYLSKPLLVDGFKFDCRIYVVITSVVPLRAYLFREGLARFCTYKYKQPRAHNLSNSCMHLTNFAVNKRSDAFASSQAHDEGSKRSLSSVFARIASSGGPSSKDLWGEISHIAEKTLLALRPYLVEHMSSCQHGALHPTGPKGFQILGFDVIFDERYRPYLLELNAQSSLSVTQPAQEPESGAESASEVEEFEISELDLAVKEELICQAMLVANPFPHQVAMRGRAAWANKIARAAQPSPTCVVDDEPIPMGDDDIVGQNTGLRSHGRVCALPRPDRPGTCCPAMMPLNFDRQAASAYVRAHLLSYRIWRHYAFHPAGEVKVKAGQVRRYLGFGRQQFRKLCDAGKLIGSSKSGAPTCWDERAGADLFFLRAIRDRRGSDIGGSGAWVKSSSGVGGASGILLDFPCFVRLVAQPIGMVLTTSARPKITVPTKADALEAFVRRAAVGVGV